MRQAIERWSRWLHPSVWRQAITQWSLWRQPSALLALLLGVDLTAVVGPLCIPAPISARDMTTAALLASFSIGYSLQARRSERARRALQDGTAAKGMYPHLLAAWGLAAAVLLPLQLAAVVLVVAMAAEWPVHKMQEPAALHRYVYSTAAILWGAMATRCVLSLGLPHQAGLLAATVIYPAMDVVMIAPAICISSGDWRAVKRFLHPSAYKLEALTAAIALAQIELHDFHLQPLMWLSVPVVILLQRHEVRVSIQLAADDSTKRPLEQEVWLHIASVLIPMMEVAAVLRVTTADQAAAGEILRMQAGIDAVGLYGDGGLAMLLVDCPAPSVDALARRVRNALRAAGVSAAVAGVAKPRDGASLDDLLAVSEAELITRDAASAAERTEPES